MRCSLLLLLGSLVDNLNFLLGSMTISLIASAEPSTFYEGVKDRNWVDVVNAEFEALNRNNTWSITCLPKGRKPIGSKWIFKIKDKASGEIERYKARQVAKGFSQRECTDYDETFSPIVTMTTVRCLINIVVQKDWTLYQLDVNNAFLYFDLCKDVYMTLPPGFSSNNDNVVCNLNKSLHGFKQALKQYNANFKKQATLSRSSTEAEYKCLASATCEIIWICNILSEFGVTGVLPVEMYCDNISVLQLAANLVFHEKSKHFEIDLHLIREKVSAGVVKTTKVHTTQQIADIFTKGLDVKQHQVCFVISERVFYAAYLEFNGYRGLSVCDPREAAEEIAPTTLEGVNTRVTELAAVQEQDT
ncbi:retrovirus-related pol polyprotein from transposon TNT 1-94 [Tanacetum coccineum]